MADVLKRSWVEIDIAQLQKNYSVYKENIPPASSIMAVVKADAYGHGDTVVAKAIQEIGNNLWAVSNIDEACKLRDEGIDGDILVLGYTPIEQLDVLIEKDITQAVLSEEFAEVLLTANKNIKCQIALDTGMNRIGLDADYPDRCIELIKVYAESLCVEGVFTHLCVADSDADIFKEFTYNQIKKFETIADGLEDLSFKFVHCLNSAGGLWHKTKYNSIVRLGIVMYGLKPDYCNVLPDGIRPALRWKSVVSMIKTVYQGESIGYGCTFTASKDMKIATIPTGYADGYNRMLSNRGCVVINGVKANIVGRICMDQFMVDVTDIMDVKMGTEVYLLNDSYTADDMANDIGTIGYEIVCNISKRVPRIYIK